MRVPGWFVLFFIMWTGGSLWGQSTDPIVGLRRTTPVAVALTGGQVVRRPGQPAESATVLIEGNRITAVGSAVPLPSGTQTIDCQGKIIYAGFIDAHRAVDVDAPRDDVAGYWNSNVAPRRHADAAIAAAGKDIAAYRQQGITVQLVAPKDRIVQGRSVVMLAGDDESSLRRFADPGWQHVRLTVPRGRTPGESYPNSPMGATALLRQAFYDAIWYRDAWAAYRATPTLPRPETNLDLDALADSMTTGAFVIDAPNERMAVRGCDIADEFSLPAILMGSGREYRSLDELAARGRDFLLPVNFPKAPSVDSDSAARDVDLQTMMHWHFAPQNPHLMDEAGLTFSFVTQGLDEPKNFLTNIRVAVDAGLSTTTALAALTTTPANMLGIAGEVGQVKPGQLANLVVTNGDLFAAKTKVVDTWVAGKRFVIVAEKTNQDDVLVGSWAVTASAGQQPIAFQMQVKSGDKGVSVSVMPAEGKTDEPLKLRKVLRQRQRLSALVDFEPLAKLLGTPWTPGVGSIELQTMAAAQSEADAENSVSPVQVFGELITPDGQRITLAVDVAETASEDDTSEEEDETAKEDAPEEDQSSTKEDESLDQPAKDAESDADAKSAEAPISIALVSPLGAYGRESLPEQPDCVLFTGAMVWTCDAEGTRAVDVLVRDGVIAEIGEQVDAPEGCVVIDCGGKHITPGLIDAHSHMATDGGVNESGQTITAEVRTGDFIDNTDITIYRQLAGGVTAASILHGSANPIGGQNEVIKLRWGGTMSEMVLDGAPAGIKFALGENVKRSSSRYPNTRMGVEQILRDQFLAARQYAAEHRRYAAGDRSLLPPRRDLQLDAIAEIQSGDRWIHCHSYRQDEIVATLDVLEEFGVQIGTLQHILEGYKVADRIAAHGAMASSFADWWAYKFEVFDAIPYNGVIMHDAGVVVSYNSDDAELGRHLNTEAAKAVKYGGVKPDEALKFVTLNPAKQLRIDDQVGSIEVGKDADLVVWSGPPLSTTTRCEQTWIDGRCYFDLESDSAFRERDQKTRATLIQKIRKKEAPAKPKDKTSDKDKPKTDDAPEPETPEEERWLRYDEFCTMREAQTGQ